MNASPAGTGPDSVDLARFLCSRLCHDLLSPVGALANGLELLAEESDSAIRQRCFGLVEQSARATSDRLRFFRLAFGGSSHPGGGEDTAMPLDEAREVVEALVGKGGRIEVRWVLGSETLPETAVRTLLIFVMLGVDVLVRGGTLDIGAEATDGMSEIVVRAAGQRIAFDPQLGQALDGSLAADELSARAAPAALLRQMVTREGGGVQFDLGDEALVLGAFLPARSG